MIMSGYGWNDWKISQDILAWLSTEKNRLILLHKDPQRLCTESTSWLGANYDRLVQEGKIVPINGWLCETDWDSVATDSVARSVASVRS